MQLCDILLTVWFGKLIMSATSVSIILTISTMPDGFDCLYLFSPLMSVIVLGLKGPWLWPWPCPINVTVWRG